MLSLSGLTHYRRRKSVLAPGVSEITRSTEPLSSAAISLERKTLPLRIYLLMRPIGIFRGS